MDLGDKKKIQSRLPCTNDLYTNEGKYRRETTIMMSAKN